MNNDIKIVKFEVMIKNIKKKLDYWYPTRCWLNVIYDYSKLNDFGKTIIEIILDIDKKSFDSAFDHIEVEEWVEDWWKKGLVDDLIESASGDKGKEKIDFIFWALMILAVDDTDKEEHLSLICDFAKILHISDLEMMDIVQVIRVVFHKKTEKIIAPKVIGYFESLLNEYGYQISSTVDNIPVVGPIFGSIFGGLKYE